MDGFEVYRYSSAPKRDPPKYAEAVAGESSYREYSSVPQSEPRHETAETNIDTVEVSFGNPQSSSPPSPRRVRRPPRPTMASAKQPLMIVGIIVGIVALLVVIIVPLSYSTLEYYQIGFKQRKSTGLIDRSEVYGPGGRHFIGPDYTFRTLPADAQYESFTRVSVFAKDRLQVSITGHMQYFLRRDQVHLLHKKYDSRYGPIIYTNALNAIKNKATSYMTREFIRNRTVIEYDLFLALRDMLSGPCCEDDCKIRKSCIPGCKARCVESEYGFYVDVRYFQLDSLDIPGDLEGKFLKGLVLTEQTEAEDYIQEASVVRKETDAEIKQIKNEAREISQDATAKSELIRSMATANATSVLEGARSRGLKHLYAELDITDQKQKASFDYLRTLRGQENVYLAVDFQQLISGSLGRN